jgi:pyruvate kinase
MPNTKIVATLGPSSNDVEKLRKLLQCGVDVFRINASHGTREEIPVRIQMVREASAAEGLHAGVLLDLQGPKIRLGTFANGGCELKTGDIFTITTEEMEGDCQRAWCTYTELAKDVKPGNSILLNDGSVELRVLSTDGIAARCEVVSGGPISNRKGINLPGVRVSTPSFTKKDRGDLTAGLAAGIDFVALSFVREPSDIIRLRHFLEEHEASPLVVAKIEKPEAVENLNEILKESDGVMVARGDLGVEIAIERVPAIQKTIIGRARSEGRFVITATQMLESMIQNSFPTRAEVSDVANAIYDGTDAVMLSAETSSGKYPTECVRVMDRIAIETDVTLRQRGFREVPDPKSAAHPEIIADATWRAARSLNASAIVVFTVSGATARLIARYRPPVPIFAFTPHEEVARKLNIVFGVIPIVAPNPGETDQMTGQMDQILRERGYLRSGDQVVFVSGQPIGRPGTVNMMKLHRLGE